MTSSDADSSSSASSTPVQPAEPLPVNGDEAAATGSSGKEAATGPIEEAEQAVVELERAVEAVAKGEAGADRGAALVVAGRASALLGVADDNARGPQVRRRVILLRSRYDSAVLRLGGLNPAPASTPAPKRQGLVIELSGVEGLRQLARTAASSLAVMGVLLLAFAVYSVAFGHVTYERNQRVMLNRLNHNIGQAAQIAAASVAGDRNLAATPPRGTPVALLEIPKIKLREVVVQGTGTRELRSAIGHYRPSPMPGQVGNSVLAGHRSLYGRPFSRIGELKAGDTVTVTTQEGRFTYAVQVSETARTGDPDFLAQASFINRLTLLTTAPSGNGGRFAVLAALRGSPASLRIRDNGPIKSDELGLGRDNSGWLPSVGWGLAMLVALVVTSVLYRRWSRWSAYLVTTPVLLMVGLLWFESAARLIPSTF